MTFDRRAACRTAFALATGLLAVDAFAQQALSIKPLAEKRVDRLPDGPLFWRVENVASVADAGAANGRWSLFVQSAGRVWLFTLGARGGATERATPGGRGRPHPARGSGRVPAADQRGDRPVGQRDGHPQSPGIGRRAPVRVHGALP